MSANLASTNLSPSRPLSERLLFAFVFLTCVRVWVGPFQTEPVANAQVPNAGAQRNQLVTEAAATNQHLVELKQAINALKDQTFKVKVIGATVETKKDE